MKRTSELKRTPFRPQPVKEPKRRQRKCIVKTCRALFDPRSITHKTCSPACAIAHVEAEKARQCRKERQEGLTKLKRRADWMKEAQTALNAWIRLGRDAGKPCISCGRHHTGQLHAGHYLARGSHPNLSLCENNLALQCQPCNVHLSGNQRLFRIGLIARIGLAAVAALESDNTPRHYSIDDLKAIRDLYRTKLKALKAST